MMVLHTFGDSHSKYGWNKINEFPIKIHHVGKVTMSRFSMENLILLNIKNYDVNEGDAVCFCFGEIDRRCHICKPQNYKTYKELIDQIINRYFEAIKMNVEQYKSLITIVFNIPPAFKLTPDLVKKYGIDSKSKYPFIGSNEEIKIVTLYMNAKLKECCKKYNYVFLDVYDEYCNNEGFLNTNFSDITIHIENPIYIIKFLKNLIK